MVLGLVAVTILGASCGSGSGSASAPAGRPTLDIELRDFAVRLDRIHLRPGRTEINIENLGPTMHELVISRTRLAIPELPMDGSGIRLDEGASSLKPVLDISDVDRLERRRRVVDLSPGHYVVFCNIPGHFLGRMYAELNVSPAERTA